MSLVMQVLPLGHEAGLQEVSGFNATCATMAFPGSASPAPFFYTTPLPRITASL